MIFFREVNRSDVPHGGDHAQLTKVQPAACRRRDYVMKSLSFLVSAIAIACSSASAPTQPRIGDPNATIDTVQVNGALRL